MKPTMHPVDKALLKACGVGRKAGSGFLGLLGWLAPFAAIGVLLVLGG